MERVNQIATTFDPNWVSGINLREDRVSRYYNIDIDDVKTIADHLPLPFADGDS